MSAFCRLSIFRWWRHSHQNEIWIIVTYLYVFDIEFCNFVLIYFAHHMLSQIDDQFWWWVKSNESMILQSWFGPSAMRTPLVVAAAAAASLFMAQSVASWTFQYDKCKDCVDFTQSNTWVLNKTLEFSLLKIFYSKNSHILMSFCHHLGDAPVGST